jgi:hypothetical protein
MCAAQPFLLVFLFSFFHAHPLGGITAFTASDVTRSVNDCDVATVGLSALGVHVLV